jgi:hypothetical protein
MRDGAHQVGAIAAQSSDSTGVARCVRLCRLSGRQAPMLADRRGRQLLGDVLEPAIDLE